MTRCSADMLKHMRTTIRIDDDLYRRAKTRAAREGRTVGELIEDAVRTSLQPRRRTDRDLDELPVYGGSGLLPGVDLDDRSALIDLMDGPAPVDVLR